MYLLSLFVIEPQDATAKATSPVTISALSFDVFFISLTLHAIALIVLLSKADLKDEN
jgi:hypothetical protein